tara:strand:+ start:1174 stop:1692 length:519 start_codon:yes stop_codon:yes gene_type:complete
MKFFTINGRAMYNEGYTAFAGIEVGKKNGQDVLSLSYDLEYAVGEDIALADNGDGRLLCLAAQFPGKMQDEVLQPAIADGYIAVLLNFGYTAKGTDPAPLPVKALSLAETMLKGEYNPQGIETQGYCKEKTLIVLAPGESALLFNEECEHYIELMNFDGSKPGILISEKEIY